MIWVLFGSRYTDLKTMCHTCYPSDATRLQYIFAHDKLHMVCVNSIGGETNYLEEKSLLQHDVC